MKPATLRNLSLLLSAVVFLIGALVLTGWLFEIPALTRVRPGFSTMKVNTAFGLIVAAVALTLLQWRDRKALYVVGQCFAGVILLIGLLTGVQYLFGIDLRIDQVLSTGQPREPNNPFPSRMSPITNFCFLFAGIALLWLDSARNRPIRLCELATLVMMLGAMLGLLGHLYGVTALYRIGPYSSLAVHTAIAFLLLGVGILAARPEEGMLAILTRRTAGSVLARRMLLAAIALPLVLGWLRVRAEQAGYFELPFGTALFATSLMVIFVGLIWWTAVSLDVADTERQRHQEELAWLASFPKQNPNPIIELDLASGRIHYANPAALQLVPDLQDRGAGHPFLVKLLESAKAVVEGKSKSVHVETGIGDLSYVVTVSAVPGTRRLRLYSNDISERKGHEQRLAEQARLLDLSNDAILVRDAEDRIVYWNKGAEEIYGYTRAEAVGKNSHELLCTEFPEPFELIREKFHRENRWLGELVHTRRDGKRISTISRWALDRDSQGNPASILETNNDISERKRAEESLRESEARFRALADESPMFIWMADANVNATFVNRTLLDYVGVGSVSEFGGRTWERTVHPEELAYIHEVYAKSVREQKPFTFEIRMRNAQTGEYRWHLIKGVPRFVSGQFAGFMGSGIDIQDRKLAEEALRESEERFRQLGENIPQLAWMTNADGSVFWFNKRWYDYTGATLDQMQGLGRRAAHHPDYAQRVSEKFQRALATGEPWEDTFPLCGKDGQYRWFLSRAFPIRDAEGNIVRWFGTNTDITELREAQANLAEREAVLRTVTNEAHVGLVMVDKDRRYLFANHTYAEILGLPNGDIVGKRVPEVLADVYDQIKPNLDRAFAGERVTYELHLPRHPQSGGERFYEVVYEPRLDNPSEPYVVVVIVDITERKQMQRTLEAAVAERTAKLRETVQELEGFSYSIAHDMRAPLRAMQNFAQIFIEDYGETVPKEGQSYLERIRRSARRLDELIHDVLDYSKVVRGEIPLMPVNTQELLEQILESYPNLQRPDVKIELHKPLPVVQANPAALTQVFSNLLGNAVKFTKPKESPCVRVWAEPMNSDSAVRLWFEDNGIGIDKESQQRIFQMFQRLNRPELYEGTGIGLAIVKKAVERMGGKVGVESERGKGSRFWVELKRA